MAQRRREPISRARQVVAAMAATALPVTLAASASAAAPARASVDDPDFPSQWGLAQVGVPDAWTRTTGAGVRIGIVDTGVDIAHEDLAGKVVAHTSCLGAAGDAARCGGSGEDDNGHGTYVAGIAAAVRGNGRGIAGVAPDAELVVAKVMTGSGVATVADVVAGMKWVVDHGARVVNLSLDDPSMTFGGVGRSAIREGIDYAWSRGAVPVLSAGTPGRLGLGLAPASDRELNAVVVGATSADGRMSPSSPPTGDARLAVLAPGGSAGTPAGAVLSTFWAPGRHDAYRAGAGTTAAAAHASGAIALLLAEGYNGVGAVERLLSTSDGTVHCGEGSPDCYGRIDVAAATSGPVQPSSR
jgi:subtilisin family serine protease